MKQVSILYDKKCWMCRHFQKFIELRKSAVISWVDISQDDHRLEKYRNNGFIPNDGIIIEID